MVQKQQYYHLQTRVSMKFYLARHNANFITHSKTDYDCGPHWKFCNHTYDFKTERPHFAFFLLFLLSGMTVQFRLQVKICKAGRKCAAGVQSGKYYTNRRNGTSKGEFDEKKNQSYTQIISLHYDLLCPIYSLFLITIFQSLAQ